MTKVIPSVMAAALLAVAGAAFAQEQQDAHQTHMQVMDKTMEQIRATEDPDERMQLLERHMDQMHSAMDEMHQNMGSMKKHMDAQKQEARKTHDHRKMRGG